MRPLPRGRKSGNVGPMNVTTTRDALQPRLDWAIEIARQAGDVTLQYFRNPQLEVERKGDDSPVTVADKEAETLLRQLIAEKFPDDAIVGEEHGVTDGNSGWAWVLDPIDGTKSFIHGIPLYTTLVAVLEVEGDDISTGRPQIGVIRAPALDEQVYALRGGGCWHQRGTAKPESARVGNCENLPSGLLLTSEVNSFGDDRGADCMDVYLKLDATARLARTWGDAYGYLMVATGRADVMIDPAMSLWDAAALQPVIEEAGGRFCDWQGKPTVHSGDAIAGNAAVVEEVLRVTQGR